MFPFDDVIMLSKGDDITNTKKNDLSISHLLHIVKIIRGFFYRNNMI